MHCVVPSAIERAAKLWLRHKDLCRVCKGSLGMTSSPQGLDLHVSGPLTLCASAQSSLVGHLFGVFDIPVITT